MNIDLDVSIMSSFPKIARASFRNLSEARAKARARARTRATRARARARASRVHFSNKIRSSDNHMT